MTIQFPLAGYDGNLASTPRRPFQAPKGLATFQQCAEALLVDVVVPDIRETLVH